MGLVLVGRGCQPTTRTRPGLVAPGWRALFAVALLVPSCLMGPLLWVAARPMRRLGFWLVALALVLGLTAAGHRP
jgi:hypothetical protein